MSSKLIVALLSGLALAFGLVGCGGGGQKAKAPSAEELAEYQKLYEQSCSSCHGADAKGITGLGKNLVESSFVKGLNDDQFLDFIKKGRPASDPANTTKVDMPPKGGNPALTDEQMHHIIAYLRSLQK